MNYEPDEFEPTESDLAEAERQVRIIKILAEDEA